MSSRRKKMTYSEVRETYNLFDEAKREKKSKKNEKLLNAARLIISWLLPWSIVSLVLLSEFNLFNAKGILIAFLILSISFLYMKYAQKREKLFSLASAIFSYIIVALAFWGI